ncbi:MAG: carboxypeptidase regulatory-like domain-containing protein [Actinomycetota bacterium]
MSSKIRLLVLIAIIASATFNAQGARSAAACPDPVCTIITGSVVDRHGNAIPSYKVSVLKGDGYGESTTTDDSGQFSFALPPATPNDCYEVYGSADAFYSNTVDRNKACSSTQITLRPYYRINGVSGTQKVYLGDVSSSVSIPVTISALSRTNPAPFANDPLAYEFDHYNSADTNGAPTGTSSDAEWVGHESPEHSGWFDAPTVRKIADGVWQYLWNETITLPDHTPGYYDMDWGTRAGDKTTVFSPMMECRMIWFGYGLESISPATALPGQTITLSGQRLGDQPGVVIIKGSGQVTTISGSEILSWSDTQVQFLLPPGSKSGWVSVVPPTSVRTNAESLTVGA